MQHPRQRLLLYLIIAMDVLLLGATGAFAELYVVKKNAVKKQAARSQTTPESTPAVSEQELAFVTPTPSPAVDSATPIVTPSLPAPTAHPTASSFPKSTPTANPVVPPQVSQFQNSEVVIDGTEDERGLGYPDSRKLVRSSNGTLFAAYRKKDRTLSDSSYMIFVASSSNGGSSWKISNGGKPVSSGTGLYDQRVPSIGIDSQDRLHVVWYGRDDAHAGLNQREIKYTFSSDLGATWSAWKNIAPIEGYTNQDLWQEHPVITIGQNNELYVLWEGKDLINVKNQQIKFIRSLDRGNSWSQVINLAQTPSNTQSRPLLIAGKNGKLVAFCYTSAGMKGGVQQIQMASSNDQGVSWSAWENLSQTATDARHVSAVEDKDGVIHIIWRQLQAENLTKIFYRRLGTSGALDSAQVLYSGGKNQFFPSLSIEGSALYAAWTETDAYSNLPKEEVGFPAQFRIVYKKTEASSWKEWLLKDGGAITLPVTTVGGRLNALFLNKIGEQSFALTALNFSTAELPKN